MRRGYLLHPNPRYTGILSECEFVGGRSNYMVCEGDSLTNRLINRLGCKFEPVEAEKPKPPPAPSPPPEEPAPDQAPAIKRGPGRPKGKLFSYSPPANKVADDA